MLFLLLLWTGEGSGCAGGRGGHRLRGGAAQKAAAVGGPHSAPRTRAEGAPVPGVGGTGGKGGGGVAGFGRGVEGGRVVGGSIGRGGHGTAG